MADDDNRAGGTTGFDDLYAKHGITRFEGPPAEPGFLARAGQTADDVVRAAADAITFGGLDWVLGGEERAKTAAARERSPIATLAGDVGGVVAQSAVAPWTIGPRVASALGAASTGIRSARNLLPKAVGFGAEGAVQGGLQAAGHTDRLADLPENLATGATMGGAFGAALSPVARVASRPTAAVPSQQELRRAANTQYDEVTRRSMDVRHPTVDPQTYWSRIDDLEQHLLQNRITRRSDPDVFRTLDDARAGRPFAAAGHPVRITPNDIEVVRQSLSGNSGAGASIVRNALDTFTGNPPHGAVLGDRNAAVGTARLLDEARGNVAARHRSEGLTTAEVGADIRSSATHSGLNYENTLRQRIASILANPDAIRGLTAHELARLRRLAQRDDPENILRYITNQLGAGGGLGAALTGVGAGSVAGFGTGDPMTGLIVGLGATGAGLGGRVALNRSIRNEARALDETLRMRSPEFARRFARDPRMARVPAYAPSVDAGRRAVANELMRQEMQREQALQ